MSEIIISKIKNELRADSRTFAPKMDIRHRQLMDNIRKYETAFLELGLLPFETEAVNEDGARGIKYQQYALLNEDQAYFLLTLSRNSDKVVAAKLALVKAFREARAQMARADSARLEGKKARREETDAIKELVQYATDRGSESARMYYATITKMTNDILGITPGGRDKLPVVQLDRLRLAETMIDVALRDGMRAGLPYKQIYAMARDRVLALVPLLPNA